MAEPIYPNVLEENLLELEESSSLNSDSSSSSLVDQPHSLTDKPMPCPCEVSNKLKKTLDTFVAKTLYNKTYSVPVEYYKATGSTYVTALEQQCSLMNDCDSLLRQCYLDLPMYYNVEKLLDKPDAFPRCAVGDYLLKRLVSCSQEFRLLSHAQQINMAKVVGACYIDILESNISLDKKISAASAYARYLVEYPDFRSFYQSTQQASPSSPQPPNLARQLGRRVSNELLLTLDNDLPQTITVSLNRR